MAPVVSAVQTAVRAPVQTTTKKGMTREVSAAWCRSPSAACLVAGLSAPAGSTGCVEPPTSLVSIVRQGLPAHKKPCCTFRPALIVACTSLHLSAGFCFYAGLAVT